MPENEGVASGEITFTVNHDARRIDSNRQGVYLLPRGITKEQGKYYLVLFWGERRIGIETKRINPTPNSIHWEILRIGVRDMHGDMAPAYSFNSLDEEREAAALAVNGLKVYGDYFKRAESEMDLSYPVISADLSSALKQHLFRGE